MRAMVAQWENGSFVIETSNRSNPFSGMYRVEAIPLTNVQGTLYY